MINFLSSWLGIFASIGTIGTFIASAFALGWHLGKSRALADEKRALFRERLERIYAPLRASFLHVHITTGEYVKYPFLRERMKRFVASVGVRGLKYAIKQLFDKGVSISSEVEYGSGFPLDKISQVASTNADVADPALLRLIQHTDRAQYEYYGNRVPGVSELTPEELSLASHIWEQYDRLSKKLGR